MPIQLNDENGGKVLVVHVSGKLATVDYEHFVPTFERLVRQHGRTARAVSYDRFPWLGSRRPVGGHQVRH